METQGAAERQTAQDIHLGFFRLRQTTRQLGSSAYSAPYGVPGAGVAIENISGLQSGFPVSLACPPRAVDEDIIPPQHKPWRPGAAFLSFSTMPNTLFLSAHYTKTLSLLVQNLALPSCHFHPCRTPHLRIARYTKASSLHNTWRFLSCHLIDAEAPYLFLHAAWGIFLVVQKLVKKLLVKLLFNFGPRLDFTYFCFPPTDRLLVLVRDGGLDFERAIFLWSTVSLLCFRRDAMKWQGAISG